MVRIIEYNDNYKTAVINFVVKNFIEECGFEYYRENYQTANYNRYRESNGNCWIALNEEDKVIGCIALEKIGEGEGLLKSMNVHSDYRGKGVAQSLYDELYKFAIENEFKKIVLGTYGRLGRAISFYKKNGFIEYPHETYTYDDKYFYVDVV